MDLSGADLSKWTRSVHKIRANPRNEKRARREPDLSRVGLFSCNTENLYHLSKHLEQIPSSQINEASGEPAPDYEPPQQKRQYSFITKAEITEVIAAYKGGESTGSIAKRLGRSRNAIGGLLKRNGVEMRSFSPSKAEVQQMVEKYEFGQSLATIGKRYGISPTTVSLHLKKQGVSLRPRPGHGTSSAFSAPLEAE